MMRGATVTFSSDIASTDISMGSRRLLVDVSPGWGEAVASNAKGILAHRRRFLDG